LFAGSIATFPATDEYVRVSARCEALSLRLHGHRCGSLLELAETRTTNPKAFHWTPMIRFTLRFFGLWLLAAAFVFLIYDGTRSIGASAILVTSTTDFWSIVDQSSREAVETWAKHSAPGGVLDHVLHRVLDQPVWLVLGIIAAILIVAGRKKKPLIGYARR
jgi:hypothetical protein